MYPLLPDLSRGERFASPHRRRSQRHQLGIQLLLQTGLPSNNDHLPITATIFESRYQFSKHKAPSEQRPSFNKGHNFRVPRVGRLSHV
jgi:hypothetical protein